MSHDDRWLLPPTIIRNFGYNQSALRMVTRPFLKKSVSNEYTFFGQLVYINSSQNTFQGTSRVRNQQVEDSRSTEDISSQSPIRKESQVVLIRSCHFTCTILYYSELLVATLYSLNHPYYPTRNKESNDSWRRLVIS